MNRQTIIAWQERAGQHCERVHEHLVQQPRDLWQVLADETRVKKQGGVVWMAMALQVSARLWLGGVLSEQRDAALIAARVQKVRFCALCRPLLFCVDGLKTYVQAIYCTFREPLPTQQGRPRLRPWDDVYITQVVKQYARRHVVGVVRRVVQGTMAQIVPLLQQTQGGGSINTAYIERLNATFRGRLASLVCKGRSLARQTSTLYHSMYLLGSVSLCYPGHHRSAADVLQRLPDSWSQGVAHDHD